MWYLILMAALHGDGRSEALCNDALDKQQCEIDVAYTMYINYCDNIEYRDEACAIIPEQGIDHDWLQNREIELRASK